MALDMSFFRYPGGKKKLLSQILPYIVKYNTDVYIEPFFGGGSVGLSLLSLYPNRYNTIYINDKDIGIACLWNSVILNSTKLIDRIKNYTPCVADFFSFKDELLQLTQYPNKSSVLDVGFKQLAVHQMSYSGLGLKAGGPIGGVSQSSAYAVDCRWSPTSMEKKIIKISTLLNSVTIGNGQCTNLDFADVFSMDIPSVCYLDPPYYVKGDELYNTSMSTDDHKRLSSSLLSLKKCNWVLSYDECLEVKKLYHKCNMISTNVNYTINTSRNKNELIIWS